MRARFNQARFPILLINVKRLQTDSPRICQLYSTELLRHALFPKVTLLHALEVDDTSPPAFLSWAEDAARDHMHKQCSRLLKAGATSKERQMVRGHLTQVILQAP